MADQSVYEDMMRNLKSYNEQDALQELRADEELMSAGGVQLSGGTYKFFAAVSDEDFMTKEQKLYHRKQKRRIHSRNLAYGIYRANVRGFVGIRNKYNSNYLFTEFHWDNGPPYGTVRPIEFIEQCPLTDLAESHLVNDEKIGECWRTNKPLFDWLKERDKSYTPEEEDE